MSAVALQGGIRLRPVAGEGVSASEAVAAAESAASFWRRQGLVVAVGAAQRDPAAAALGGSEAELALCEGAMSPAAADAGALARCQARALTAPLAGAVARLARPAVAHEVVVLALARLVAPGSPVQRTGLRLPGLAVSDGTATAEGLPPLGVPPGHTPVVFLDVGTPRRPGDVWTTPAHEVGHALGLLHRPGGEAVLMRPGVDGQRCWPGISAEEARQVSARLAGSAPELPGEHAPQAEGREPGPAGQGDVGAGDPGDAPG